MKKFLATTAVALIAAGPIYAAAHSMEGPFVQAGAEGDLMGSELIGKRLYVTESEVDAEATMTADGTAEWDDVGEINDVLISKEGEIKAVLLDIGGFLGIGEKRVAVSMDDLKFVRDGDDADDYFVVLQGATAALEEAPDFSMDMNMEEAEADMEAAGEEMEAEAETAAAEVSEEAAEVEAEAETEMAETEAEVETEMAEAEAEVETEMAEADTAMDTERNLWDRPAMELEGYTNADPAKLTAEALEGANVYDANEEDIGEIVNLVLSEDGQITQMVADIGGFLGLGEHRIAIEFDEAQILRDESGDDFRVFISATKEQLEQRPEYEDN